MSPSELQVDACRRWLDTLVEVDCRSGFYDEADILTAVDEIIETELGAPLPALLAEYTSRVQRGLAAHAADEATWTERTVNDCIDSAFADLDTRGIAAAQALGSTVAEGSYLIDERASQREDVMRGSVFYHRQDLERGVAGQGLLLAHADYARPKHDDDAAIGREIVHVLRHHGVAVDWNGSSKKRIAILPFEWQKRRCTKAPPGPDSAPPWPAPVAPQVTCALCNGRGWVSKDPALFPEICSCKSA